MKTRILTAAILVPILLLLVLVAPPFLAAVVLGVLLAIGSYELLYRTHLVTRPRLVLYSSGMAFAISLWSLYSAQHSYFVLLMIGYFLLIFSEIMMDHVKVRFEMLCMLF